MAVKNISRVMLLIIGVFALINTSLRASHPSNDKIGELIAHFDKEGTNIKPFLEDERFALIEDITGKFRRAVEIKIGDINDYKELIRFEQKKGKVAEFVSVYSEVLEKAEKKYGIPKTVIIGILGVESEYGMYKGKYNPFNAYVSMYAEGYRSDWALAQLEELLIWTQKNDLDVMDLKSSYAGAMSYAQFIPWSLNRWFVGGDLYDMPNNIYSVANYLAHYKEVTGSLEKAVLRYNPSTMYQQAVLSLAAEAEGILNSD